MVGRREQVSGKQNWPCFFEDHCNLTARTHDDRKALKRFDRIVCGGWHVMPTLVLSSPLPIGDAHQKRIAMMSAPQQMFDSEHMMDVGESKNITSSHADKSAFGSLAQAVLIARQGRVRGRQRDRVTHAGAPGPAGEAAADRRRDPEWRCDALPRFPRPRSREKNGAFPEAIREFSKRVIAGDDRSKHSRASADQADRAGATSPRCRSRLSPARGSTAPG